MSSPLKSSKGKKQTVTNHQSRPRFISPKRLHTTRPTAETVEQFLARGGQVERLATTTLTRNASQTMRDICNATWKQTQDKKQAPGRR